MRKAWFYFVICITILLVSACFLFSFPAFAYILESGQEKEALYYEQADDKKVACVLCPRRCIIPENSRGFCRVRENRDGVLYSLVYARPCAVHIDPVEKKPLFHVLPGTRSFSVATVGCNLSCKFCQNWQISQARPEDIDSRYMPPEDIVEQAIASGCSNIAYTYTEPTVFYEYMLDTAKLARKKGILNIMHSAGFINEEPLRELSRYLDAANIDLKGSDRFYRDLCAGTRADVLRSLKILKQEGVWVEITYLLVPTLNDQNEYIRETAEWIKNNLGADTPLHISRFWPVYKLKDLSPTPVATLQKAYDIATEAGLLYVYIGNVPGAKEESTYCPDCKGLLIRRIGYNVSEYNIKDGCCNYCGRPIEGIWQDRSKK
jgi:pyruvate formate lyase activating enzyme